MTISHYKLLELLGQGAMGEVWLAEDLQLPRKVAVKLLPQHLSDEPEAVERLLREAQAAASVDHPGVVTIYEAGVEDRRPYLVMQRVEGPTLEEHLAAGPMPVADAVALATQVADALAEVHALGIVHRDLKPANIMVTPRGAKILDFGIASVKDRPGVTMSGYAPGTPYAMSPEQIRGLPPDNRSDLWAVGVILYQCLTGKRPFEGATFEAVTYQVLNQQPPAPGTLRPGIRPELDYLVTKLLRKDPAHRYSRSEELLADLAACCLGEAPAAAPEAPAVPRLAVLHFEVLSQDGDDAFLAVGLTEDLIVDLTRVEGLRVASRAEVAPYRDRVVPPRTLARELNADYVLLGSVRRAGNRARISAQLVRASDGHALWAERFDRTLEDLFDVQAEVSHKIVEALQVRLKPEESRMLDRAPTHNAEAYPLYLQARLQIEQPLLDANHRAEELLKRCLELDPRFALAEAALAETYGLRAWIFREHVDAPAKALQHAARALELEPGLVDALYARSMTHFVLGQPELLLQTLNELRALDPDRPQAQEWTAFAYLSLGRPEAAAPIYERLLERHPERYAAGGMLADAYMGLGRPEDSARARLQARERLVEYLRRHPHEGHPRSLLAVMLAHLGDREGAMRQAEMAMVASPEDTRVRYNYLCALAVIGESDRALDLLEEFTSRNPGDLYPGHFWFDRDPDLENLRNNPRFARIMGRA